MKTASPTHSRTSSAQKVALCRTLRRLHAKLVSNGQQAGPRAGRNRDAGSLALLANAVAPFSRKKDALRTGCNRKSGYSCAEPNRLAADIRQIAERGKVD